MSLNTFWSRHHAAKQKTNRSFTIEEPKHWLANNHYFENLPGGGIKEDNFTMEGYPVCLLAERVGPGQQLHVTGWFADEPDDDAFDAPITITCPACKKQWDQMLGE